MKRANVVRYTPRMVWLRSRTRWMVVVLLGSALLLPGAGCQKALFPSNQPRTQFQAHDEMRNRFIPTQEFDVFGNPQPALRARLVR